MTKRISGILILMLLVLFSNIFVSVYTQNNVFAQTQGAEKQANTQEYVANDGTTHTIYWAQGIEPPKMDNDEELEKNKPGFFKRTYETLPGVDPSLNAYVRYKYPIEDNKGYYDLNKNPDMVQKYPNQVAHHCYLAAAMNLIHWWMDQNSTYIDRYIQNIKDGHVNQLAGLSPINNYDLWNKLRQKPVMTPTNRGLSQEISQDPMYEAVFKAYINNDNGGFPDMVWDNFFNGYLPLGPMGAQDKSPLPNNPDLFKPSSNAGFFYPIFTNNKLSSRVERSDYAHYNKLFKEALSNGIGISLFYHSVGVSHAITLYGAEYDSEGNLMRVYITDSDDFDSTDYIDGVVTGLASYNFVPDEHGLARLTTNIGSNFTGSLLQGYSTLDLNQDLWEAKLNDSPKPIAPEIVDQPLDANYSPGYQDVQDLFVNIKIKDTGVFTYQWYKNTINSNEGGEKIVGATKSRYKPDVSQEGTLYYYVEITNTKNENKLKIKSNVATINVNSNFVDAKLPNIYSIFNRKYEVVKGSEQIKLSVGAESPDNGTLSYQWYVKYNRVEGTTPSGGYLIEGATQNELIINTDTAFRRFYYCIVTNHNELATGSKISNKATKYATEVLVKSSDLKFIKIEGYELSPIFNPNITSYTLVVPSNVSNIKMEIECEFSDLYGPNIIIGDKGYGEKTTISLNMGENNIKAQSYNKANDYKDYNIKVIRGDEVVQSDNNYLSNIILDNRPILGFDSSILKYSVNVESDKISINLDATAQDEKAQVTGIGKKDLNIGDNAFDIIVQAENGNVKTYTVNIHREDMYVPSSNSKLSGLTISTGTLNPVFSATQLKYTVEVPYDTKNITLTGTKADEKATIEGNGEFLFEGTEVIKTIKVIAEDKTSTTYTITITRGEKPYVPSSNSKLSELTISVGTLNPVFSATQLKYTVEVPYDTKNITLTGTKADNKATIEGNGEFLFEGAEVVKTIKVTAEDKSSTTYTITITRGEKPYVPSSNSKLSGLTISVGTLNPTFSASQLHYTVEVPYTIENITITGTKFDENATIEGNGTFSLSVGENVKTIKVTAEDKTFTSYTITITRKAHPLVPIEPIDPSDNNDLSNLKVEGYTISPEFNVNTFEYKVTVPYKVTKVNIIAEKGHSKQVITIVGGDSLVKGKNLVQVKVKAENGALNIYTIEVTRSEKSKENSLDSIIINGNSLGDAFDKNKFEYDIKVPNNQTSVDIQAIVPENSDATVLIIGANDLKLGNNVVTIKVIAEDGTEQEYLLNVFRRYPESNMPTWGIALIIVAILGVLIGTGVGAVLISKSKHKNS